MNDKNFSHNKHYRKLDYINKPDDYENETYIDEQCWYCGEYMNRIEDILVELDTDRYCCADCTNIYNLKTIPCTDLD